MRECKIILPASGDPGEIRQVERDILSSFGGYTKAQAQGAWADDNGIAVCEDVLVYTIATTDDGQLQAIAADAGDALEQTSVYIKYCDGEVELV